MTGAARAPGADYTALDRYVAAPDASYRYSLARTVSGAGVTVYQLDLVSQSWLTPAEVDRTEWRHSLNIAVPSRVVSPAALLFINGGSNRETPAPPEPLLPQIAAQSGLVIVELGQVPNQPLRFSDESRARSEDAIIAYSWDKYLRTGDERWPLRLPMTKAVVRAMDAAVEFLARSPAGPVAVENFIVTGGSKRGWTAWTAAAVDARVIAAAPLVIDIPNVEASFIHHWRAYGFWAPAIRDYEEAGIMNWFGLPQIRGLLEIEDPYEYRERLTLPKYCINSAGDQFFLPDSAQFYFHELPGEKYLRYVPNTDHSLASPEAALNLLAWVQAVTANRPRPRFYWRAHRDQGSILLRVLDRPSKVLLWKAGNPKARDFRLESIGPAWRSAPVEGDNGIYFVEQPKPEQGWTAFFLELTYPGTAGGPPLVFTTEVLVTPDVYPFDPPAAQAGN